MMNEQEMQFADPDWKPDGQTFPVQATTPTSDAPSQPVNRNSYDVGNQSSTSSYEQGYRNQPYRNAEPYSSSSAQHITTRPVPVQQARRGSYWWLWIVAVLLLLGLSGGIFGQSQHSQWGGGSFGPSGPSQFSGNISNIINLQGASQVNLSMAGDITVQVDDQLTNSDQIQVQTDHAHLSVQHQGETLFISSPQNFGGNDLTVLVPENIALNLNTSGDIEVDGFNGQLSAQSAGGDIQLNNDALSGNASFRTVDGDINFQGTLDSAGQYTFATDSGSINLALPADTSMQVDQHIGNGGSYQNNFPGPAGSSPRAQVTVQTNTGDVTIAKQ